MSEAQKLLMLPGPTNVPPRVMRAMLKPLIGHRGPEFKKLHQDILEKTKKVFETKRDLYILTASGTGATECALQNIIDDGDKIIVNVNGFFSERLSEAITAYGGRPITVESPWGKAPRLPVDKWQVDVCVTASQKCLMCPPGLSFISVSDKAWSKIQSKKARRSYYFDLPMWKKYGEDGYTPFTPSVSLFYALNEACDMILEEGLTRRYQRHRVCAQAIYGSMEAMGLGLFAEEESRSYTVAAIQSPPGIDEAKVRELIRTKYGIGLGGSLGQVKGKIFRIGIMGNVGPSDIMTTVSAIGSATAELGFNAKISEGLKSARETLSRIPGPVN